MQKTILITGSTDGIGLATAKVLISLGHNVIIHGRNKEKVEKVRTALLPLVENAELDSFVTDLSNINAVKVLANDIKSKYSKIDVLINNAGVYNTSDSVKKDNLDIRFIVNTIAPYILTKELMSILNNTSRVVNLSSAAQAPVNIEAISNFTPMSDGEAYAQSKLALTMWSTLLGEKFKANGPVIVSINPKSLLGSKMVKDAYGIDGADLSIGADILSKASLSDEFNEAHGKYFDNDRKQFAQAHPETYNKNKSQQVIDEIEKVIPKNILLEG